MFNLCYSLADISSIRVGCLATIAGLRHRAAAVPIAWAAACPLQGALGDRERGQGWIYTPDGILEVRSRRPQALRIFRDAVLCAGPPFPTAVRHRDGEGRAQQTVRATPHFLSLFPISIFPPSPPFLPDSIGNFSLLLQSSQPLLTH